MATTEDFEFIKNNRKLQNIAKKNRLMSEHEQKLDQCYEYYAKVDTPVSRIMEHLAQPYDAVIRGLRKYGRIVE